MGVSQVDWSVPDARPDPVYGTGAGQQERRISWQTGVVAAMVVLVASGQAEAEWALWQYVLAALVVLDLVGGVVANGFTSAKRDHFTADSPLESSRFGRLVRRPVLFAAVHVQPVAVGLLFPGAAWWWGPGCYLAVLASVVVVRRSPLHLQRPVATASQTGTPDGHTAQVTLVARARPPLLSSVISSFSDGIPLRVTGYARAHVEGG